MGQSRAGTRRGGVRGIVAVVVAGLALAGCGGDDPEASSSALSTPGAPVSRAQADDGAVAEGQGDGDPGDPTASADDPLDGLAFDVGQTFWHSGYAVTIESGTVVAERDVFEEVTGHTLTLAGTFENLGDDPFWFGPELNLVQGSDSWASVPTADLPEAGGGLSTSGEVVFFVDETFDPDAAELVVGRADQARARMPLGVVGDLVALAPQDVDVTGTFGVSLLEMEVTGADLRWDVPVNHDEVEEGSRALTLAMTATSRKTGNWQVFPDWFFLTTPDGTSVPVDGATLGSLAGSEQGTSHDGLYVRFLVDEDATGDFTLVMQPSDAWLEDGPREATLEFTLS